MSNSNPPTFVRGTVGDDDLRAVGTGSQIRAGAGNDILRGGRGDDLIIGGAGDDQLYGGGGADQFRFFGNQIDGANDIDRIYDLNFNEGDILSFGAYNGLFGADANGFNSFDNGDSAIISSYEGLFNAVQSAGARATVTGSTATDLLFVTFDNGDGQTQTLRINNAYAAYLAAGSISA